MPEIKTRDVVSGTIKTIDRSAIAGQRMKDAYVQAKSKAEHSVSSEDNEYASDQMENGTAAVIREGIHQVDKVGHQIARGVHHFAHTKEEQQIPNPPPQSPTNNQAQLEAPNAQQPHRLHSDGAVPHDRVPNSAPSVKQHAAQCSRQSASLGSQKHNPAPQQKSTGNIKSGKDSIKTSGIRLPERTIKTGKASVKTLDQFEGVGVKTVHGTMSISQKGNAVVRTRQHIPPTATFAKKTADFTAKAAKAIADAMQELVSLLTAGGGVVMILVIVLVVMCFAGMMLASDEDDTEILPVSDAVSAYEPIIQQYAREHGIPEYTLLIEAVMMQESGGRGADPMQCSECSFNTLYPHRPGGIPDPEYSINVGIQNLANCLQIAGCESPVDMGAIKLALQGYNYGQGYITWAMNKYGEYTKSNAVAFSLKTAEQYGWDSYGDMDYVPHVLRYYPLGQIFYDPDNTQLIVEVAASQIGNVGGQPYWSWYGFTERVEWCACFVSWCANQCGYIDAGIIPKFSGCEWGVSWFKQHDQWASRNITPIPGMIIFFDWKDEEGGGLDGRADHVGIVAKVDNGRVYTIEGNSADSCRERSYPVGYFEILGYGIPAK